MSIVQMQERFTSLPGEETLADPVVALREHGFIEVADALESARQAVLSHIPDGSTSQ